MLAAFQLFGQKLREYRAVRILGTLSVLCSALIWRSDRDIQAQVVRIPDPHSIHLPDLLSGLVSQWESPVWGAVLAEGGM